MNHTEYINKIKDIITEKVNNLPEYYEYIYGAVTNQSLFLRKQQHIINKDFTNQLNMFDYPQPLCDGMWEILPIIEFVTINQTTIHFINNNLIKHCEQHLIDSLFNKYGKVCINDIILIRDEIVTISQTGGRDLIPEIGDNIKLYIFFLR